MAETRPTATAAAKPASSVQTCEGWQFYFLDGPSGLCNYWIFNLEISDR